MTPAEAREFLLALPARTAKLATARVDGRPHVVPVWIDLDGDDVMFTTGADTVKGRAIERDRRVALCVDDERPPFAYVMIEGRAEVQDDPEELRLWATRIGARYMGDEKAEAYGNRNAVPGELLVRVRPSKVVALRSIAD
jgi:PPOX class probable F420-dependent enzyme